MSSKKRLLSLIVSLAMAASVSYTPVYALDEDTIQATIEIPTGSAEGSYTYTVGSDETSTATETNSGDITTETEQAADGTDTTDSAASSDTEIAEQADTTEQTDTEEQESDAPAETTESPAETTKASAAGAASTAADTLTAEEVQELIDALPSLTELIEMDTDEANEVYTAFSAACEAYDALSADEQAEVDDSKLDDLAYYFNGMVTVAETSTVDVSSATSLTGVTTSYTRNYTAQEGTTCWDFTDVTDFNTSTLYSAGEGLYVYMNSDSSINSTYNGIYGKNWVETDTETATATQYIVFKPTEVGKLSFSAIYIGYTNSQGSGASGRVVYTTDGSVPNKGTESGTGTNSSALIISSTNQSSNGVTSDTIYNVSIEITSDDLNNTYVITAVRGSTAAYSALYDIMYTVEDTTADVSSTTTTYTTTNDISTFASAWKKTNANVNTDTDNSRIQIVSTSNSAEGSAIYPLERGSAYVITLTYKMNNSSTFGFLSSDELLQHELIGIMVLRHVRQR